MPALKLTVTDNEAVLTGLTPHAFADIAIRDTSNGKSQKLNRQANALGAVQFNIPMFDNSKSISVLPLIQGESVHDMIFERSEDPNIFTLYDSNPTISQVIETAPIEVHSISDNTSEGG